MYRQAPGRIAYFGVGTTRAGRGRLSSTRRPGPNDAPCAHFTLEVLSRLNSLAPLRRSLVKVCSEAMASIGLLTGRGSGLLGLYKVGGWY